MAVRLDPWRNIVGVSWADTPTEAPTEEPATEIDGFTFIAGRVDFEGQDTRGYRSSFPSLNMGTYVEGSTIAAIKGVWNFIIHDAKEGTSGSPSRFFGVSFFSEAHSAVAGLGLYINGSFLFTFDIDPDAGGWNLDLDGYSIGEGSYPPFAEEFLYITFTEGSEYTVEIK